MLRGQLSLGIWVPEMWRGKSWCPELPKPAGVCQDAHWPLYYHSISPSFWGLPLLEKPVLGFGAGLADTTPPLSGLGGFSPTTLPVAPSQGWLGCSGFCLKKTENKRKRILLGSRCGPWESRKGFDKTDEACSHNVQIGRLTSAGQEMQVMAGTQLLPHIAAG